MSPTHVIELATQLRDLGLIEQGAVFDDALADLASRVRDDRGACRKKSFQ